MLGVPLHHRLTLSAPTEESNVMSNATNLEPSPEAVSFFYEHDGFSYNPETETEEEGHRRCAQESARDELLAKRAGITFEWEDDWSIGDHEREFGEAYADGGPSSCEQCTAFYKGEIVASLGCVDDATPEYRRVVEGQLASEALGEIDRLDCTRTVGLTVEFPDIDQANSFDGWDWHDVLGLHADVKIVVHRR